MKRFLLFLSLVLCTICTFAYDYEVNGIFYNLNLTEKTAEVTNGSIEYAGKIIIPASISKGYDEFTVTSIGKNAFQKSWDLTSIEMPNTIVSIGDYAFDFCCEITSIVIPNSVISIGNSAFYRCSGLTTISISNSVISIGKEAFKDCSNLSSINIPNSVRSIGDFPFIGCRSLPIADGIRYADTYLVGVIDNSLSEYQIKDGTRFIGSAAFTGCEKLASFAIPNSVESIEKNAFMGSGLTTIDIPNSVTNIGAGAFSVCKKLVSVNLPEFITRINYNTFDLCTSLRSIIIPDLVTFIGDEAFSGCTSLASVIIPNSVDSIEAYAFDGCSSLTTIDIPNSVTSIGRRAFRSCSKLSVVCNFATTPQTIDECFSGTTRTLYVPDESLDTYKASTWKNYFAQILPMSENPSGIEEIQGQNPAAQYDDIYSISGARRPALQKGLNIVGGKKVLVK